MAIEKLNTEGMVIGGKKIKFEAWMEDDQADPRSGFGAAQKLVDMHVKAANELKPKQVSIIDDRTVHGQGVAKDFAKIAKVNGIKIVSTDFNAILTSIKSKKPDGIFYGGYSLQGGPMTLQMKQLGIKTLFMGGDGICAPEMGRLGSNAVTDQVYCTQGGAMLDKLASGKEFAAEYQKRFNHPAETYAASFYDGMMVVAQAMKEASSVEPKQYVSALAKIKYKGIAGMYEFDTNRNLKQSSVTVFRFKTSY